MNLPRNLHDFNVFTNGTPLTGQARTITLPKLVMNVEEYLGAGMGAAAKLHTGSIAPLEFLHNYGGEIPELNAGFGDPRLDGQQLRFAGAYKNDAIASYDDVQISMSGRTNEIDTAEQEIGSKNGVSYKTDCVYYKQVRNGVTEFEVDTLNKVLLVYGVDRWAQLRSITR
ncbi:major tail tube protein [Brevundimonas intermedia]|uniref:Major tail tube protein n=1 Tax=Brevundimonas intermedia TaxID=74315 RepID=A0ABQ5TB99_9CAUL|nr:phage major tail tube protein [Brevundimonas intermedia]GLK49606.1 major tail tube protein [Brevundimonas intermedia]